MKILVSACLLGENCKYSGGNNYNQAVCDFARGHQVVPVCPEVLGGLPTPRCPAEIVQGVVTNKEGINVDREFRAGAAKALAIAKENGVELAILQSRSPSCGTRAATAWWPLVVDRYWMRRRRRHHQITGGLCQGKGPYPDGRPVSVQVSGFGQ